MTKTALVVTTFVIGLGIFDLVMVATGGIPSSVSRFMQDSGFEAPFVVFTVGFICGHLFGYMKPKCIDRYNFLEDVLDFHLESHNGPDYIQNASSSEWSLRSKVNFEGTSEPPESVEKAIDKFMEEANKRKNTI